MTTPAAFPISSSLQSYTPLQKDILEPSHFINPTFDTREGHKVSQDHARYLFPSDDIKDKLNPYSICIEPSFENPYDARRRSLEIYKHEMNFRRNMTLILIIVLVIFVFIFMWFNAPKYSFFS